MNPKFTAHPWHGISAGENAPEKVNVYVEIVPSDTIKYEVDKSTGLLKVDRPQKFSNVIPAAYGFIPQTYCEEEVRDLAISNGSVDVKEGDKDPLDILVLSSHYFHGGNFICEAIPIGGFKMIDKGEADDKIISVLVDDQIYGKMRDISDLPEAQIKRLQHYFLSYKNLATEEALVRIDDIYGAEHAKKIIEASRHDYEKYLSENK